MLLLKNILNNSTVFEELLFISSKSGANEQNRCFVTHQQNLMVLHPLSNAGDVVITE